MFHELFNNLKTIFGLHKKRPAIRAAAIIRAHLESHPDGVTSAEVAEATDVPKKQVSVALSYLVKSGYATHHGRRMLNGKSLLVYTKVVPQ